MSWVDLDLRAWRRLLPVWLPAVALALTAIGVFVWQTSERVGRAASLEGSIRDLEEDIARLNGLRDQAVRERETVEAVQAEFQRLYGEVFGDLENRLTRILREVYAATLGNGLNPEAFNYRLDDKGLSGAERFTISFAVNGEYEQLRQMLAALQESPEFLVVESIALAGENEAMTRSLSISIKVSTFLSQADPEQLRRLTGGLDANVAGGADGDG